MILDEGEAHAQGGKAETRNVLGAPAFGHPAARAIERHGTFVGGEDLKHGLAPAG